jgi:Fe-Mn family superoxide dismutase
MQDIRQTLNLLEEKNKETLVQAKLPYKETDLAPVKSKATLEYHYGQLYKGYVDRYNKGEGDADFNKAGAFLHNIYFTQFHHPKTQKPTGAILNLILRNHKSFADFKNKFKEEAMKIQGSGWIYLSKSGQIKTIRNHAIRTDIALLVDWWEHAWALDYQSHKAKYLDNIWRIIDWNEINKKL